MLALIVLIVSVLTCLVIGLSVYLRNPEKALNRAYALLTIIFIVLSIANFGTIHRNSLTLLCMRLVIACTTLGVTALFMLFVLQLEMRRFATAMPAAIGLTAVVALVDMSDKVFPALTSSPTPIPQVSQWVIIFIGHFVLMIVLDGYLLLRGIRSSKAGDRAHYMSYVWGVIPIMVLAPLTAYLLPIVFHDAVLIGLTPLYVLNFVGFIGYSIVRHRMFDVRLIVARSIAYILVLLFTAGLLGGLFLVLSYVFLKNIELNQVTTNLLYLLVALGVGMTMGPLKRRFDRITNRLFFRDSYDSEVFLDSFNKLLVSTYELEPLLRQCCQIIETNIKPTYCTFALHKTESLPPQIIGATPRRIVNADDTQLAQAITMHMQRKLIVTDKLEEKYRELQSFLRSNDVAILTRLTADLNGKEELGYLLLGPKKSGNTYTVQDLKLFEIINNELVIAIQNALRYEEIENFNETLQQRVDDATRKLRRTNQRLRELDDAKDDFVSMASHQLRTPLTSIKGYTSMVLEGDAGKITPMQKQLLEQSFTSAQRMVYLIADLLNVSRLKTGKFVIEPGRVNLADMVQQELAQLTAAASDRQQTLEFIKPDHFPTLMLDETKTRQVIMNFVDNAIYYTPTGGHITVKLEETPVSVELRVTDTGIGVARSDQPHLFTKFYRASNARKARPDGTGLGLFMAKKVITAEGGAIIFETQEGKGSTFGFVFPKAGLLAPGSGATSSKPVAAKR